MAGTPVKRPEQFSSRLFLPVEFVETTNFMAWNLDNVLLNCSENQQRTFLCEQYVGSPSFSCGNFLCFRVFFLFLFLQVGLNSFYSTCNVLQYVKLFLRINLIYIVLQNNFIGSKSISNILASYITVLNITQQISIQQCFYHVGRDRLQGCKRLY